MKMLSKDYWQKGVNDLLRWLRAHPLKGCAFSAALACLTTLTGALFAEDSACACRGIAAGLLVVTFTAWAIMFTLDNKKLVAAAEGS